LNKAIPAAVDGLKVSTDAPLRGLDIVIITGHLEKPRYVWHDVGTSNLT
jgi:hypothetical protein